MSRSGGHQSSLMQPVIVGVVLALLVGSSSPWWWSELFPSDNTASQQDSVVDSGSSDKASGGEGDSADQGDDVEPDGVADQETADETVSFGCTIVIANPLVTLYEDTDTFGLEAGRAPPGTYGVEEVKTVTFAGKPQRWFQITTDGDTGWVQDNSILIESKSGDCQ